jgi:uncharacterized protein YndB with AHSA1/START domain
MVFVTNKVVVRRPIAAVFDVATTGEHWTRWHPATQAVRGAVKAPVQLGEKIVEDVIIAGRAGTATWTCTERDPPHHLTLEGTGEGGTTARIVYTFAERSDGTEFTRDLTYNMPSLNAARGETLTVSRVMREQSAKAMTNLKALLEAEIPDPAISDGADDGGGH